MSHLCTLGLIFTILLFGISYANASETIPFVSTYAGTGVIGSLDGPALNATFHYPRGLELDSSGNLYVADFYNNKIRIIHSNGTVSTYAGTGVSGSLDGPALNATFYHPFGLELDSSGNLYVADYRNHKIRIIYSNGTVSTFAGTDARGSLDGPASSATFFFLYDIELDPHGNLYVADYGNNKIRIIYSNGTVSTFAGTGARGSLDGPALNATFNYPRGLELDSSGNLYVADYRNHKIRIIHSNGTVSTYAGTGGYGSLDGPALNATFNYPSGLELDSSGNLYVTDTGNHKIRIIYSNGTVSTFAGTGASGSLDGPALNATFYYPFGLELDSSGNLYVSTIINIRKITTNSLPFSPPPIITLIGDNPQIIERGLNYTELGATINDNSIITINDSSVDTNTLGNYTVIYYTIGDFGNIESLVNRTVIIRDSPILYTLLLNDTFDSTLDDWQFFGTTRYQATHSSEHGGSAHVFGEAVNKVVGIEKNITIPYASSENFVLDGDLLLSLDFRAKSTHTGSSVTNSRIAVYDSLTNELLYYEYLVRGKYLDTEWRSFNINLDSYVADHNSITIKLLLYDAWYERYEHQNWFDNILLEVVPDNSEPVITLFGNNPQNTSLGYGYVELGAMTDDGSPIVINNTEFIDAIGTYSIYYDSTDLVGNNATQVVRTVNVVDAITLYHYTFTSTTEDWEHIGSSSYTTSHDSEHGGSLHIYQNKRATYSINNFGSQKTINISETNDVLVLSFDYKIEANPDDDIISLTIYDSVTSDSLYSTIVTSGVPETGWRSFSQDIYPYVNNSDSIIISLSIRDGLNPYNLYPHGWFDNIKLDTVYVESVIDTTPPIITLIGDNPQIIERGLNYTELGATTNDNSIITINDSSVDTNTLGNYTVIYYTIGDSGNIESLVNRTVIIRDLPILYTLLLNDTFDSTLDDWQFFGDTGYQAIHSSEHGGSAHVFGEDVYTMVGIEKNITIPYASSENFVLDGDLLLSFDFRTKSTHIGPSVTNSRIAVYDSLTNEILYDEYLVRGKYFDTEWRSFNINLDSYVADHNSITIKLLLRDSGRELYEHQNWFDNILLEVMPDINEPVITLFGNNPQNTSLGYGYVELGAMTDDGSPIVINNTEFIDAIGTYSIYYDSTDLVGNNATQVVRTVNVVDAITLYHYTFTSTTEDWEHIGSSSYTTSHDSEHGGSLHIYQNKKATYSINNFGSQKTINISEANDVLVLSFDYKIEANPGEDIISLTIYDSVTLDSLYSTIVTSGVPETGWRSFSQDIYPYVNNSDSIIISLSIRDGLNPHNLYPHGWFDNIKLDTVYVESVIDTTPPIITLIGDNPQIIERGLNYTELGATTNDNSIITINDSSVDTNTLGNYTVIYYTIGDSGNIESLVNRTVIIRDLPILYTLLLNDTFDSTLDDWQFFGTTGYQATHSSEHGGSAHVFGEDAYTMVGIEKNITIPYASSENFVLDGDLLLSFDFRAKSTTFDSSVTNSRITVYDSLTNELLYDEYLVRGKYLDTEWRSFNINLDSYVADHNSITIKLLLSDSWLSQHRQQNWFDNILLEVMPDIREPVITLLGNNPQNTSLGYGYVELGAMTDDGSPIVINNTEFIDAIGTYSIYYDSTDLVGNNATQVVRTVNVVDTITLYHYTFTSTTEDWEHIGSSSFTTSHDSEHGGSLHIYENTIADGINNFGSQKTINISEASDVLVLSFDYKIEANPGEDIISLTIYDSVTLDSLYSTIVTSGVPETGWRSFSQDIYPYVNNSDSIIISLSIRDGFSIYNLYPHGWFDNIKLDTVYVEPVIGTIPFVSTFAGTGVGGSLDGPALNATFYHPFGLELDSSGNLYVTDAGNNKIRIIYSNGTVSTYAGTGARGSLDGPASSATFVNSQYIELDPHGNLYVADTGNNKIRIIHSNGTVSTYAGTGVGGSLDGPALNATFYRPFGLELDSSGNLYVTDTVNHKIRIIYSNGTVSTYAGTGASGSLDGPALNATFNHPRGLELDSSGNLYVTDTVNHKIRIIYSNGTVSTYAGTGVGGSLDGPALNATFNHPRGLELDSSGNLYVTDTVNHKIRIIYSNGTVSTYAGTGVGGSLDGPALNATFSYPLGLELDSSGNLYVSTSANIRKITTNSLPPSPLPIITLIGDNPQIIERGLNYTELGATTNDNSIITINDSSVDTNTLGNYTVIYYTIGDSGNIESLVNRTVIIRDLPILYTLLLNDTFDSTLDDWQFFGTTGYQATHSSEHGGSAYVFGEDAYTMVGIEKNITIPYASSENFVLDGDLLLSFDFRAKSTTFDSSVTNSRITVYDSLTNELLYDEYLVRGKYLDTEWRSFNINLDSYVADHNSITIKLLLSDSWLSQHRQQNWFDNILLEVMPDIREPVITLLGNNPQNTSLGYGYVELGAMTDDGSPIVINNTEFIDAIGTYSIYYDSTDLVGNNATQVVRTVNVVDTITLYHYTFTSTTEDWEHIGSSSFTTSHDSEHGGSLHIYENTIADGINNFGSQKTINISEASDVLVLSFDYKIEANPGEDIISLTIYDSVTLDSLYSTIVTSGVPETGWRSFSQDIYPYVNNSDSIIISLSIRDGFSIYNLYPHGWFDNIKLDTVYVEPVIGTIPFVSTFAGTGVGGSLDGPALNATFYHPFGLELDSSGNLYVTDAGNNKIRIIYSNGTVSTYAGTGARGSLDGPASSATFVNSQYIELDPHGNLYVADTGNNKIRIIHSNGTVSTYAGTGVGGSLDGPALNATFYRPFGLELDSSGNLYVTDTVNHKIRIIYSNGTVSTYAGTGASGSLDGPALNATFNHPRGLELDSSGNLYVTDTVNHKIRIIYSNGTVSTYAGTGVGGSLDGPALNATFNHPRGLELDSSGNLYVTDTVNHKIRIIYSNGTVSTYAGTGVGGSLDGPALNATFSYPLGLELDSSGNLYVSTSANIRKITTNSLPPSPLPIITLIGDNPQIIERGLNYTELGATTNDNSIITINDSSVDTNTLGNYTVIYYTIGDSGNIESLVNRTVIIRDLPILYTLLLNDTLDSTLDDWQFFGTTGYQATHSSEHGGSAYVFGEDAYTMVGIEKNITIPYASSENFVLDGDLLLSFDFRAKSTTFDSSVTNSRITVYDSLTNELLYDEYLVRGKYLDTEWRSFNINLDSYVADHNSITIKLLLSDSWLSQHRQQNWFDNILLEVMPDIREPVITLLGNNPQNTSLGYGYVELGAMTDDGSPIVINNTEFIDAIGTYSIYYDSTDLVGNNATQVVRTVNVVDTITLYHYTFTSTTEDWEHIGSSSFTTSHDSEHGGSLHIYENTIADGINNFGSQKTINISKASDVLVLSFDYKIEANPGEDIISLTIYDSVTLDSLYSTIVTSGVPETGWRSFSQDIYPYVNNSDSIIISLSIRDGFSIYNLYPHGWFDNIKLDTVYVE